MDDLPKELIIVISGGRITLPKKFREELGIGKGSVLEGQIYKGKLLLEVLIRRVS